MEFCTILLSLPIYHKCQEFATLTFHLCIQQKGMLTDCGNCSSILMLARVLHLPLHGNINKIQDENMFEKFSKSFFFIFFSEISMNGSERWTGGACGSDLQESSRYSNKGKGFTDPT